jgi:PAS domain-containing protein
MSGMALLHESLAEILPDAVLLLDVGAGRFMLANLAAEQMFGRGRSELASRGPRRDLGLLSVALGPLPALDCPALDGSAAPAAGSA